MSHPIDPRRLGVELLSEARHAIDTLVGRISPTAQHPAMTIAIMSLRRVATAEAHPSIILPAAENVACEADHAWWSDTARQTFRSAAALAYLCQIMMACEGSMHHDNPAIAAWARAEIRYGASMALSPAVTIPHLRYRHRQIAG